MKEDALLEERKPLLDLDDVERLESELAACFDAPPPPPLNIDIQVSYDCSFDSTGTDQDAATVGARKPDLPGTHYFKAFRGT